MPYLGNKISPAFETQQRLHQLAQMVQQASEGFVLVNLEGLIEFANPAFCRETGYTLSDLRALGAWRYPIMGDDALCPEDVHHTLEAGRVWNGRHRLVRKDGSRFDCLSSIAPLRDADGCTTHFVGVHRDIAMLARLENQSILARYMESIATLAGGIARDFNDILAEILGHIYMALRVSDGQAELTAHLNAIEKQGYRAVDITRQLLAFARKGASELVPLTLNEYLKDIVQMMTARIPSWVVLTVQVPAEPIVVRGDAGLLQQAIMNLLGHVLDSMSAGDSPRIRVTLGALHSTSVMLDRGSPAVGIPDCERYACIRVCHNGPGMDKEVMDRLFEPGISAKAVGGYLELDMAMVKGCVEMHMGQISVDSDPGNGTEFTIMLPCSDHVRPHGGERTVLPARGEMILLIDGDYERRKVNKDMLIGLGFAVLASDDLGEVEHICSKVSHALDLAVVDLDTPGLGEGAVEHIKSSAPDTPLLLTSSQDGCALAEHWISGGAEMLVHQPKRPDDLVHTIQRMIKRRVGG